MLVLGIETSCDETAAAVVENGRIIRSNVVNSQIEIHARYGGVVPEVASRQHILSIVPVIEKALDGAGISSKDLGAVAVTHGPGLAGSLLVGVNSAKALALAWHLPLTGINHLEGHIYANWLDSEPPEFPLLCLIVSGGHSDLVLMRGHGDYTVLGRTRDDAAGEAFDKAARILGLGFPGGPAIQKAAAGGRPSLRLARAWLEGSDDFSFSGVKAELHRLVEKSKVAVSGARENGAVVVADAAASFQEAVTSVLAAKTAAAARERTVKQILLAGGVAANRRLRERLSEVSPVPVRYPPPALCTDNAAMTAACGYFRFRQGKTDGLDLDVLPALRMT
ncbi:MAG: tRNA (adenosine(37)-N6)-threonylcarbamoyltransferase complex transferase subunit TsaD [Dehalococcoidia bacterium]|nr:MAG: tRNA (adenosine(37)-N6)-threonylcarbamoyltransferase complex transferase subunit TsaD [Dehalococcoidia bacterium]